MGNSLHIPGVLSLDVSMSPVFWDYGRVFIASDRCLDACGVYGYHQGRGRSDVTYLPYMPFLEQD